jgi:hypothetical protein
MNEFIEFHILNTTIKTIDAPLFLSGHPFELGGDSDSDPRELGTVKKRPDMTVASCDTKPVHDGEESHTTEECAVTKALANLHVVRMIRADALTVNTSTAIRSR